MPLAVLVFPPATAELVRGHAKDGARVIAVDAGAEACLAAGVVPEAVVGDMDSVRPGTLDALHAKGARIVRHPTEKRDTDGALALAEVRDADEVLFLGASGGRADHAFANLHLMWAAARRGRVRAVDEDALAWVVTPRAPLALDLAPGTILSALPLFEGCDGVTYEGLRYGLEGASMRVGDPYGMSNVAVEGRQTIRISKGALLVVVPRVQPAG